MASILTPAEAASSKDDSTPLCGVCRRQFSRYTCPRCNLLYCSLQCFRSEMHSQCSEPFYRTQLETDIHSEPSKTAAERTQMLSLLKRFEDDALDDPFADVEGEEGEEDDGEDLQRRMAGIDLESASYEAIWSVLTPAERDAFTKAIQNPSSELAQQLVNSAELEDATVLPWWEESSSLSASATPLPAAVTPAGVSQRKYGAPPPTISVPPQLLTPASIPPASFLLAYNLVAILIAYAYATRHFGVSPLTSIEEGGQGDARSSFSRLVPLLVDRRSTTKFETLEAVVTDVYSRFEQAGDTLDDEISAPAFAIFLRDTAILLQQQRVSLVSSAEPEDSSLASHPSSRVLRALGDLQSLFQDTSTAQKLAFYAAQVLRSPSLLLDLLRKEVNICAAEFVGEKGVEGTAGKEQPNIEKVENVAIVDAPQSSKRLVEELP
ncbi:hypothetical protein FA95DRAFT_1606853 [Auriscalpium vulgare]|uniref:Uncharacterized protein n=1 Tax=Auriscalpium vulgare TaxID=40419 RepID=A0ACB8RS84_9AGAM|nr:hypothetical protein FA95DRAFT_1606853 [Auriscalpium vulgare]